MSTNYSITSLAMVVAMSWSGNAMAINPPTIAQELTDGDTYLLMNYSRPNMYLTRTSWDGAYRIMTYQAWLGNTGAWQPIDFTAHKNDDGTWSFLYNATVKNADGEPELATFYLGLRSGSGNLNPINEAELEDMPIKWNVTPGIADGYYKLVPGEGNPNDMVIGHPLHLNGGGEYPIIYFEGNGWGFDIYGGIQTDEYDEPVYEDENADWPYPVFNNYEHTNWAFIHEADIERYNARYDVYAQVADVEANYLETPDFEAGFEHLAAAAGAFYEADQLEEATALIKAGKALYNAILNADNLNETGDAALQAAIDKAQDTFNNGTADVTTYNNTSEALNNALKIYLSGDGDFTSFGQNMSFENLDSQNGNPTSGVAGAPAGWNLYLNGKQCVTASDVRAEGVSAWCGINADGTGMKDGEYIFGIWNNAMPNVELSQTITGLENGTYYISASVMVGANGGGSRMSTQRIFGNLNSALFGMEEDYNKSYLNPSEVYEYAGLSEPVTDTELQEMSVSAYVYDGTLTFGFRTDGQWKAVEWRDAANGAGGDGWFKLDNFHIQYLGYDVSDALNIMAYYQDQLGEYMSQEMQDVVAAKAMELYMLCPEEADEINAAILQCRDYMATVKASVDAYAKMREYMNGCVENMQTYAGYSGMPEYEQAVLAAYEAIDNCTLDEAGLEALRASLDEALTALVISGVFEGKDVTNLITNPSFEDLRSQNGGVSDGVMPAPYGWNVKINGVDCATVAELNAQGVKNWCAINRGDDITRFNIYDKDDNLIERQPTDGDYLWGLWANEVPEVELSQTITDLPSGTYILTADVMVQWDWAGDNLSTQRIFANNSICMYGGAWDYLHNATPDMQKAIDKDRSLGFFIEADYYAAEEEGAEEETGTSSWLNDDEIDAYRLMNYAEYDYSEDNVFCNTLRTLTLKFVVAEDGVAKIGFRTNGIGRNGEPGNCVGWFKVDNFTLYYDSRTIPTSIDTVKAPATVTSYYTLDGVRLATPRKGINIVRQDGKTFKVLVK